MTRRRPWLPPATYSHLTEDQKIEAALRYECGESVNDVCASIGFSERAVRVALKTQGVALRPRIYTDLAESFWQRVQMTTPDGCWLWQGQVMPVSGYGSCFVRGHGKRGAHRVAFFLTHGRWALVCRHSCDVRLCCNPTHLLDGTHTDNMRDMTARGRAAVGRKNGSAKLTADEVLAIRAATSETTGDLMKKYGVSQKTVWNIRNNIRWNHL